MNDTRNITLVIPNRDQRTKHLDGYAQTFSSAGLFACIYHERMQRLMPPSNAREQWLAWEMRALGVKQESDFAGVAKEVYSTEDSAAQRLVTNPYC